MKDPLYAEYRFELPLPREEQKEERTTGTAQVSPKLENVPFSQTTKN
jgi:hypothetical protein